MAFDKRGYFYLSERVGGRVTRQYFGKGHAAAIVARMMEDERRRREAKGAGDKSDRQDLAVRDQSLVEFSCFVDLVASVFLEDAGCHRHRGQWRKRRGH